MSNSPSWNGMISVALASADAEGRYVDAEALSTLKGYFRTGQQRVHVATIIAANAVVIVKKVVASQTKYLHSSKLNYTVRQYAACVRDLDYFLRYTTYAVIAGDYSILDERLLNGLVETYVALNISIDATLEAILAMKEVVISVISQEDSSLVVSAFDYIYNSLAGQASNITSRAAVHSNSAEDKLSWEPRNYSEWLNQDKLAQQIQQDGTEDLLLKDSAEAFFEALSHAPYSLRKQVWREREVMAALYQQMTVWKKVPGFLSVSVGRREMQEKNRLVGIINFVPGTLPEIIRSKASIPYSINVDSSISELKDYEKEIPIVIEVPDTLINHSTKTEIDATPFTSITELKIQSGDSIAGVGANGAEGSRVTLTTFVISKESLNSPGVKTPHLLTVHHGFSGYKDVNICKSKIGAKIGEVVCNTMNIHQQNLAEKLDVALVRLSRDAEFLIKPHLRWIDEYPKRPIPIVSGMPVQMFGGTSGHVLGVVDESMIMYPGPNQSIIPSFSVTISSQPGDSGSLLVVGHHSKVPVPEFLEDYMSEDWANLVYSMQGILLAGSTKTIYGDKAIFRPMITVLHWLKLQLYRP